MSIFKGDSIYKSGGGGGGYKNGGELVDGDFIKVENNTVSSYDNVSRDPINLYFEPKDGEILNSIVELTTEVNATVNVYVVKNGFYYLLGNIGGNTVNAGDDYKINVIGDSFSIEQVSALPVPEYVTLEGEIYPIIKVDNFYWLCKDLKNSQFEHVKVGDNYYYKKDPNININGWKLPVYKGDNTGSYNKLLNTYSYAQLRSTTDWPSGYAGNNQSGFDAKAFGYYDKQYESVTFYNWQSNLLLVESGVCKNASMDGYSTYAVSGPNTNYWCPVRLVHDV